MYPYNISNRKNIIQKQDANNGYTGYDNYNNANINTNNNANINTNNNGNYNNINNNNNENGSAECRLKKGILAQPENDLGNDLPNNGSNDVPNRVNNLYPDNSNNDQNSKNNSDENYRLFLPQPTDNSAQNSPAEFNDPGKQPVVNKYILELIKSAIAGERANVDYYSSLAQTIDDPQDKTLIHRILNDERKHYNILNNIYYELKGEYPSEAVYNKKLISSDIANDLAWAVVSSLDNAEFYQKFGSSFLNLEMRDWIDEIKTDEQAHSQLASYLFSKYKG